MLTIELSQLRFYAYHGLYEEEKILGGEFEVDAEIVYRPQFFPVLHLEDTIDYTCIYELIKKEMQQPTPLLETLAVTIAHNILAKFSQVEEVKIWVKKIHPFIAEFEGSVSVNYEVKRNT